MAQTWHVTAQIPRQVMSPSGQFVPSVEVHFQLADGTTNSVTIPKNQYSDDVARERIQSFVDHLSAVADLTG